MIRRLLKTAWKLARGDRGKDWWFTSSSPNSRIDDNLYGATCIPVADLKVLDDGMDELFMLDSLDDARADDAGGKPFSGPLAVFNLGYRFDK